LRIDRIIDKLKLSSFSGLIQRPHRAWGNASRARVLAGTSRHCRKTDLADDPQLVSAKTR